MFSLPLCFKLLVTYATVLGTFSLFKTAYVEELDATACGF